jgi:hypothetical protein
LKLELKNETHHSDFLEKETMKTNSFASSQVKALRKAFSTLADVLMEEMENLRHDFNEDIEFKFTNLSNRVD